MATYKKRGYKLPKEEVEVFDNTVEEEVIENAEDSTTEDVFNTLEETANKSEKWIEQNSKPLFIGLVAAVVVIFGYMGYNQFIVAPKEKDAADALVYAKQQFTKADAGTDESLYTTALEGAEGNYGLVDIADNYGSTKAGNLAKYYAGISYINLKEYAKAIDFLKGVSTEDSLLNSIIAGSIGDAYLAQNNTSEALSHFTEAAENSNNNAIAPVYLMKAGKVALSLKNYSKAEELLSKVKETYPNSAQAKDIDLYINQAKYAN